MARRASKTPFLSVVLAVHDAAEHLARAVESVLNQGFEDLELVLVDCGSRDRTAYLAQRFVDRDYRVEYIALDGSDLAEGRLEGIRRARGSHVMLMSQCDWCAAGLLEAMADAARESDAQLVIPSFSIDAERADGNRASAVVSHVAVAWKDAPAFREAVPSLLEGGLLSLAAGKMIQAEYLSSCQIEVADCQDDLAFMCAVIEGASRVCALEGACYHVVAGSPNGDRGVYDKGMYARVERDHGRLGRLLDAWGMSANADVQAARHRVHLQSIIRCIENACLSDGRVSPADRRRRVQEMIDAPETRVSIEVLRSSSRDFGIMYGPIARRNAAICCMGARLQEIVSRALQPQGMVAWH